MNKPIQLLVVEDSTDDYKLILRALKKAGFEVLPERVETAEAFATAIARERYDAVVSDYNLAGFTGIDALHRMREAGLDTPFILVSGVVGEELAVEAMKCGANDFILKGNLSKLGSVLSRELKEADNRAAARRANEEAWLSRQCMASVSEGILITGPDRLIVSANPAFEKLTGYLQDELHGRSCALLQGPKSDPQTIEAMREALKSVKPFRGAIVNYRKDGTEFWNALSISPVRNRSGDLTHFVGIQRDISDTRLAQNKLRLANRVFSQAREAVVVTDRQGAIELVNEAFTAITGYDPDEVLGHMPDMLVSGPPTPDTYASCLRIVFQEGSWRGEIACRRKDGRIGTQWLTITVLYDSEGEIANFVGTFSDITEQLEAQNKIAWLSQFDVLTGLPNRDLLSDRCDHAIATARSAQRHLSMLALSLKNFSDVNDAYGHAVGDELLQQVAQRIRNVVRDKVTVSRVSGSNFVILLNEASPNQAADTSEDLEIAIAHPFDVAGQGVEVRCAIGIAVFPEDGQDFASLFKAAEFAMRAVRSQIDAKFSFFNAALYESVMARGSMLVALRSALKQDQLRVHYQPFVDLKTGRISGMEALLRWTHPELGAVSPGQFIPMAEKGGLIGDIGAWVINQVCSDVRAMSDAGLDVVPVSVNISPVQFHQTDLSARITTALAQAQIAPALLCLEITEGTLIENVDYSKTLLEQFKSMGLRLSLDDFGTGYSSLSYLKQFPFDKVKIDQSFIQSIGTSSQDEVIIKVVIAMAHGLGMNVIAEGVETESQCAFVRDQVCDEIQGYFFARPAPLSETAELIRQKASLAPQLRFAEPSATQPG